MTAELLRFWFQQRLLRPARPQLPRGSAGGDPAHHLRPRGPRRRHAARDLYEAVAPDALLDGGTLGEVTRDRHQHPKYAAKMATGTGKTWVLNALLVWQYLNKLAAPERRAVSPATSCSSRPGLIVYDRLLDSFLGKDA